MCIPLAQGKHSWSFSPRSAWSEIPPYAAARVHIFHTNIHQRRLYIMDASQNWVMMDAMARNQGTKMHWLLFQPQCLVKMQAWCWMPILQRVLRWRAGYAISGLSPKLLPSTPTWPLLLDKVYWNFTITLNFEDDLGSEIQFINWLIHH